MAAQDIELKLSDWFLEEIGASFDPGTNYLTSGEFDSFGVINLITFAETTFGIRFSAEEFQKADFFTIAGLARMIDEKRAHG
jgi:acyl carrier protein